MVGAQAVDDDGVTVELTIPEWLARNEKLT